MINPTFVVIGLAVFASSVATHAQSPSLLIENVTLIDGTGRPPVSGAFVLTDGDRIVRISRERIDAPNGTVRIDGRGKYLIPGLMDMHIHLSGGRGQNDVQAGVRALHGFLYSGFTSVFDAGNNPDYILGLRAQELRW